VIDRTMVEPLQAWCPHYTWDDMGGGPVAQVRWMTAWDTTETDVERFAAGVATLGAREEAG
jgi:threonine aldolase